MSWLLEQTNNGAIWWCGKYSDLRFGEINNFAEFGQPWDPDDKEYIEDFVPDFGNIVIRMAQSEIFWNGYGGLITANSFSAAKNFIQKGPRGLGVLRFSDLMRIGLAHRSERVIARNLYKPWVLWDDMESGDISIIDAAYVHGRVNFSLSNSSVFYSGALLRYADVEIIVEPDNWDFESDTVPQWLNDIVKDLLGPGRYNLTAPIKLEFYGPGKRSVIWSS